MNCLDFKRRIHQLLAVYHLRGRKACLLVECVLYKLFLEPEVLKLLLSLTFPILVHRVVHDSQLMHLFLLFVLHIDVLQNNLACFDMTLMPLIFFAQECIPLLFWFQQPIIPSWESFLILWPMIFNRMVCSFCDCTRFLFLCIKLVYRTHAELILTLLVYLRILFVVASLCFKLRFAFLLNSVQGAWVNFCLVLDLSSNWNYVRLRLISWLVKRLNRFFLLILRNFHALLKLEVAISGMLQFFALNLFDIFFDLFVVFFKSLVASSV